MTSNVLLYFVALTVVEFGRPWNTWKILNFSILKVRKPWGSSVTQEEVQERDEVSSQIQDISI